MTTKAGQLPIQFLNSDKNDTGNGGNSFYLPITITGKDKSSIITWSKRPGIIGKKIFTENSGRDMWVYYGRDTRSPLSRGDDASRYTVKREWWANFQSPKTVVQAKAGHLIGAHRVVIAIIAGNFKKPAIFEAERKIRPTVEISRLRNGDVAIGQVRNALFGTQLTSYQ